jgi:hypothetical protein
MSLSGDLSLEDVMLLLSAWMIDDWPFRVILLASPGVILNSGGNLRWRTDNILELSWSVGSLTDGSLIFPVDETVRFRTLEPGPVASEYPQFGDIGGGEARYSDCLEIRFPFGRLLLLRYDLSMFDPPDSDS